MANDCCGTMRVVSKSKEAIDRFERIMRYNDDEFFCYRVFQFDKRNEYRDGEFYCADFYTDVAWGSSKWFYDEDSPGDLIVLGYENNDWSKPIHGTAHYTSVTHLAATLKFGVELWTTEPGCGFAEHATCTSEGEFRYETEEYTETYPKDENGDEDYDEEPTVHNGFGDEFDVFSSAEEIYGQQTNESSNTMTNREKYNGDTITALTSYEKDMMELMKYGMESISFGDWLGKEEWAIALLIDQARGDKELEELAVEEENNEKDFIRKSIPELAAYYKSCGYDEAQALLEEVNELDPKRDIFGELASASNCFNSGTWFIVQNDFDRVWQAYLYSKKGGDGLRLWNDVGEWHVWMKDLADDIQSFIRKAKPIVEELRAKKKTANERSAA